MSDETTSDGVFWFLTAIPCAAVGIGLVVIVLAIILPFIFGPHRDDLSNKEDEP